MMGVEYESETKSTKDTLYRALTGELWFVSILKKIDHVIMALPFILNIGVPPLLWCDCHTNSYTTA